ncbi:CopG-like DNA-binding [Sulfurimonas denitrificans DSM 1251]|jgi:RHH-type rel operon transcriptional repressor/antitoxin RelB|uniref:CopG-like DNA-binding n=1 Tax=Sulfurimonas denitrificans (strain ATCC 33889 / DSM 1251) TaxID=326298 RepID=Q30P42_SULDN|nr:ribbon-helix-helix domain-containing protein [Sulfurimonas denitrificans]ABB45239.1 CopG-like DNA-binding [Sulfurimonas denitrificans DSM 1251]MDD3442033.1 ribbon-helix-helix domain-containing protein [Sulfurimonas denitrificans]
MLSIRLENSMEAQLNALAEATKRPKSFFVKEALRNYLDDMQEYYEVQKRSNAEDRNLITLEELERALEL